MIEESDRRTNWAGNYKYEASRLHRPESIDELQRLVLECPRLKALGARHSFNGVADSEGEQVSLERFDDISLDPEARTVRLGAGVTYGQLCPWLNERGFAVHNLASLPHLSVVGACATATHGSGIANGNLSTAVTGVEFVTAAGEHVVLSRERDGNTFAGAVVGLGGLGIITCTTLRVEPAFSMAQAVYLGLSFSQLDANLDEIFSSGYSVSLFTNWNNGQADQVWIKQRANADNAWPQEFFGARPAEENRHPLPGHEAENCTEQMGVTGPWYERLPHFRMNFVPSSGSELQSEYFVPREAGAAAVHAIEGLSEQIAPHLFVSEIRTVAGDDLWMSPCYRRPSLAIHFTWKQDWAAVKPLLGEIEERLAPFGARPHWGKLFTMRPEVLESQYERLPEFQKLLRHYDPEGKFRNDFLGANIFGEASA